MLVNFRIYLEDRLEILFFSFSGSEPHLVPKKHFHHKNAGNIRFNETLFAVKSFLVGFKKCGLKRLLCYVLMTSLYHVWEYCYSESFHLTFYLPNGLRCKVAATSNKLNINSLLHYIWYPYSNLSVGADAYDFNYDSGLHLCVGENSLMKWKGMWLETHSRSSRLFDVSPATRHRLATCCHAMARHPLADQRAPARRLLATSNYRSRLIGLFSLRDCALRWLFCQRFIGCTVSGAHSTRHRELLTVWIFIFENFENSR